MLNREIIRLKVVQIVYAFYQNTGNDAVINREAVIREAEKELFESYEKLLKF